MGIDEVLLHVGTTYWTLHYCKWRERRGCTGREGERKGGREGERKGGREKRREREREGEIKGGRELRESAQGGYEECVYDIQMSSIVLDLPSLLEPLELLLIILLLVGAAPFPPLIVNKCMSAGEQDGVLSLDSTPVVFTGTFSPFPCSIVTMGDSRGGVADPKEGVAIL